MNAPNRTLSGMRTNVVLIPTRTPTNAIPPIVNTVSETENLAIRKT